MPTIRHIAHKLLPKSLVAFIQQRNKKQRNKQLAEQAKAGGLSQKNLVNALKSMGINEGDVLQVHAALSKIGYVAEGPKTVVDSLLEVVGESGHLLMPSSSNNSLQLEFIQSNPIFDVKKTPSKMGAISEYFRNLPKTERSLHPTESVCCYGPNATHFVVGHFGAITPYLKNSPFGKVIEHNGKILMVGVTFDNAGTHVHCLEDAVDFPFPVYHSEIFNAKVIDELGKEHSIQTKVHNPIYSKKRYCDFLIDIFEACGVLTKHKLGSADCMLIDAKLMFDEMQKLLKDGITIYGKV